MSATLTPAEVATRVRGWAPAQALLAVPARTALTSAVGDRAVVPDATTREDRAVRDAAWSAASTAVLDAHPRRWAAASLSGMAAAIVTAPPAKRPRAARLATTLWLAVDRLDVDLIIGWLPEIGDATARDARMEARDWRAVLTRIHRDGTPVPDLVIPTILARIRDLDAHRRALRSTTPRRLLDRVLGRLTRDRGAVDTGIAAALALLAAGLGGLVVWAATEGTTGAWTLAGLVGAVLACVVAFHVPDRDRS